MVEQDRIKPEQLFYWDVIGLTWEETQEKYMVEVGRQCVTNNIINIFIYYRSGGFWVVNFRSKTSQRKKRTDNPTRKPNTKTRKSYNIYGKNDN